MLKKRIVVPAMIVCSCLLFAPCPSQASPLSWAPGVDVIASFARLLDLLPGLGHPAPAAKPHSHREVPVKQGCGIDPNGVTVCGPGAGTSGSTSTGGDPDSGL